MIGDIKIILDRELQRLKKRSMEILNDDFQVGLFDCPHCKDELALVTCSMKRGKGRYKHKHRILNLTEKKLQGSWV